MPPIPAECVEYPSAKTSRTRLNFGESNTKADARSSSPLTALKSTGMDIFLDEEVTKTGTIISRTKRAFEHTNTTPNTKRTRHHFYTSTPKSSILEPATEDPSSPLSSIINAVERLSTKGDLVADGSRENILPTITGKHSDLNAISQTTMSAILNGDYDHKMDFRTVIDCRYPYEFEGGHIQGAINLYTKEMVEQFLKETATSNSTHVLIFHCEFSSERGPKMYRFLRSLDRELNKDNYPRLNFPEIYLLEGGYKAFYYEHKEQCYPQTYKPMLHKDHKEDLRHFRVKSKSWSAGEKTRQRSIKGGGLRLRF